MADIEIDLGKEITIRNIQPLYHSMLNQLDANDDITLNAHQLERLDTAGAQCLYLFQQSCEKRGVKLSWLHADNELVSQLSQFGIHILEET
ncbi:STAS domain-containing protein [Shewanella maritima]|uniref:STAS domain-containing protein n=1 Tax=Shewanella maritima TaxID=2520507 RepID=UPI003734DB3E